MARGTGAGDDPPMFATDLIRKLLSLALALAVGLTFWYVFGRHAADSLANRTGLDPANERVYLAEELRPVADSIRDRAGADGELLEITLRPGRLEVHVLEGDEPEVLESEYPSYGRLRHDYTGVATRTQPFPARRFDPLVPEKLIRRIEAKEGRTFALTLMRLAEDPVTGKLGWEVFGRVGQRGAAYSAKPDGTGFVSSADRAAAGQKAAEQAQRTAQCIRDAGADTDRIAECVSE
jgi:hypothetical protein